MDRKTPRRSLVLHADDLGMNDLVSAGILRGFREGLLTSTSVLANAPGCSWALAQWKDVQSQFSQGCLTSREARRLLADSVRPFDLGIHLNLTQGRPLTGERYPRPLLDRDGLFPGVFRLATLLMTSGSRFHQPIHDELRAQIEVLLDSGFSPTHLNAHQYVDILPVVAAIVPKLVRRYEIPIVRVPWERRLTATTLVRRFEPANWCLAQVKRMFAFHHLVEMRRRGMAHPAFFFGTSHAGRIDLNLMRSFLAGAGEGITEIGMHPGSPAPLRFATNDTDGWHDPLAAMRSAELSLLTSPELVTLLESQEIHLARLSDLSASGAARAAA
jgi:predicted glycoside hydrolase/deacetylase ChbG (UPF0249 family)